MFSSLHTSLSLFVFVYFIPLPPFCFLFLERLSVSTWKHVSTIQLVPDYGLLLNVINLDHLFEFSLNLFMSTRLGATQVRFCYSARVDILRSRQRTSHVKGFCGKQGLIIQFYSVSQNHAARIMQNTVWGIFYFLLVVFAITVSYLLFAGLIFEYFNFCFVS